MTKINIRSPFYLSFGEPVVPQPAFDCDIAKGSIFSFSISQRGELVYNELAQGSIVEVTSTAGDFANGKFADVAVNTVRTVTLKIQIPSGFSNTSDGFFFCDVTATQPLYNAGTSCVVNTTPNGSIADQTIAKGGTTTSALDLSTKFTAGSSAITGYRVFNSTPKLISTTTVSKTGGSSQSIQFTSQDICGTAYVHIYAVDALSNSCEAHQQAKLIINGCTENFDCTLANLEGGGVAQDGVITMPSATSTIPATGSVSTNSDGSNPIAGSQPFSTSANSGSSAQDVTLYFKILIPAGYANTGDGSQYIWCGKTFSQQASNTLPAFDCDTANLTGYNISARGAINQGQIQTGTIKSFSPIGFAEVETDTARNITFTITSPNEATVYSNPNADITCVKTVTQPAYTPVCGSNVVYLTAPFQSGTDPLIVGICEDTWRASRSVLSPNTLENLNLGNRICTSAGSQFDGQNFWYGVRSSSINFGAGIGAGVTKVINIDENGIIQNIALWNCDGGGDGDGGIL